MSLLGRKHRETFEFPLGMEFKVLRGLKICILPKAHDSYI